MVMKNVMRKNLLQSIWKSLTRYVAIVAIIALGAGIFVGLRTTKSDMVATGQKYMDELNMFDLRLLNTYGWSQDQLDSIRQLPGVEKAEGIAALDVLVCLGGSEDESVYKLYGMPEELNMVHLQGGRMPQNPQECLIDGFHADDSILGTIVTITPDNDEDTLDSLTSHTFTVVGYVSSPLYMDMSRGTTTLGSGSVSGFLYIPQEALQMDYYTEIHVTLPGKHAIYTEEYDLAVETAADEFRPVLEALAADRYAQVKLDAQTQYEDGLAEYDDGMQSYLEGKQEAEEELAKAEQELLDGEKELEENRQLLEDGQKQIEDSEKLLAEKKEELLDGEKLLNAQEEEAQKQFHDAYVELLENYNTVSESLNQVNNGIAQIDEGLFALNDGISQLESGLQQMNTALNMLKNLNAAAEAGIRAAQESLNHAEELGLSADVIQELQEYLEQLNIQRQEYVEREKELQTQVDEYTRQLNELKTQRSQLQQQRQELVDTKVTLEEAQQQIDDGFVQLEEKKAETEDQIAQARSEIREGKRQLEAGEKELAEKKAELEDGLKQLEEGEQTLKEGWEAYETEKEKALQELADAEAELADAKAELDDAAEAIASMTEPDVYTLGRSSNSGYLSLDSSSDIVKGVSTVFPAFFLLIAALVCITTMTRMVEEERTEIGTLKALGYTNWEIVRKYLIYSGSAAVVGCGLGVIVGSLIFPMILWNAYGILLSISIPVVLRVDWALCAVVVLVYTTVNLLVTWYCCRRLLVDVPAELIRPKAPTSGRKILLEYLPFWNRIGFLNKVMLRNIFRYTQRLLMMLIGIGGCTALLLTGFGLRDSIVDVADYQFEEITLYDMDIRFPEGQTQEQMESFRQDMAAYTDDVYFFNQSNAELIAQGAAHDVTMIVADGQIVNYMDFHYKDEAVGMPGQGEAVLSVGIAEMMDLSVGDSVTLQNSDMQTMNLTISGIYENYVYNYILIAPETYVANWGQEPQLQMACLRIREGQDVHLAGAQASQADGVLSVTLNQDLADQVRKMMEALDLVVVTIVICAGALAVIVLYNLTNINITERIREIATIKVLGFRSGETAAYVFKENLLLSAMGAALGLLGGQYLLKFVISQIKVDTVWLLSRINPASYFLAIGLTMLCAVLVDYILYFRLEKINMAEALKSVE